MATLPAIVRASFAMPDVHWGYGFLRGAATTRPPAGTGEHGVPVVGPFGTRASGERV
ncbi:RtcB family protein [Streptomyces sp. NPDC059349]|uniref:RtcB family protein n=1 Tax=Streptomyces sp. NPDC059349 TaxID=3346808 RepID=UPI0036C91C91